MLVKNKKSFGVGIVFSLSFLVVLGLIFSPVFGGKNGLVFSDDSFNKLSKGSSYFIPKVVKSAETLSGKQLSMTLKLDKPEDAETAAQLFLAAGAAAEAREQSLKIEGDFGAVLLAALKDADAMYHNDGNAVSERYGFDEKKALRGWWTALSKVEKELKKQKLTTEAGVVSAVTKKAIEPAYNYYRVEAQKVSEHAGMMTGLLVFYVAYTMWWGYAIYYLFEGIGLTMKKAKVKREA